MIAGLQGERVGDVLHIVSRHFNPTWTNQFPISAYMLAYMRQFADANLLGNISDTYVENSFAFGYRSDYHLTGGVNGVAGCPERASRRRREVRRKPTMFVYVDYTATCGTSTVRNGAQFTNITNNACVGTTVGASTVFDTFGSDIAVQGANWMLNFDGFRSFRSNTEVVEVAGSNNNVEMNAIWTNNWNACGLATAGCDDGRTSHFAMALLGSSDTLQIKSRPNLYGTTTPSYDVEGGGTFMYAPAVEFFGTYSGNVPITAGANTTVIIDQVAVDTISAWNAGSNLYFPTIPGNYRMCADVTGVSTVAAGPLNNVLQVRKNTTTIGVSNFGVPTGAVVYVPQFTCAVAYLNGSTDYLVSVLIPNAAATANRLYGAGAATSIEVKRVGP